MRGIKIQFLFMTLFALASFLFLAPTTYAQSVTYEDIMERGLVFAGTSEACEASGDCTLNDVLQVFVNIAVFLLGISGSVALLIFVYAGVLWLTAGGRPERVAQGKQAMIFAVIGLAIMVGAYTVITLLISVLTTGEIPDEGTTLESVIEGS